MKGKRVTSLYELSNLSQNRRSVITISGQFSERAIPAAFVMCMQGQRIMNLLRRGIYLYTKEPKNPPAWERNDTP